MHRDLPNPMQNPKSLVTRRIATEIRTLPDMPCQSIQQIFSPCKWRTTPSTALGLDQLRLGYEHMRGIGQRPLLELYFVNR